MKREYFTAILLTLFSTGIYGQINDQMIFRAEKAETAQPTYIIKSYTLMIVNGIAVPSDHLFINNEDIESVTVLKADSALAEYGEESKNGVVEIALKPGSHLFNYTNLVKKFNLDPGLKWVVNNSLLRQPERLLVDASVIKSLEVLEQSPTQPPIPHLPNEKMVYLKVR